MQLLSESDRRECDELGKRIRSLHRVPEWDDQPPFTKEQACGWAELALAFLIAGALAVGAIAAIYYLAALPA
jgi:hypothetical protein